MKVHSVQAFKVLTAETEVSIKRLAWAFGCAKKGSDEEIELYRRLVDRLRALPERAP